MSDISELSPLETKLKAARLKMLLSLPFFGKIILHIPFKEVTCIPTAATDGRFIYYNKDFMEKMDFTEILFVCSHEVLHVVYDHIKDTRRGSREPFRWNAAADYVINYQLDNIKDHRAGKMPSVVNPTTGKKQIVGLLDEKYKGMCAEEVYNLLEQNNEFQTIDCHISFDGEGNPTVHTSDGQTLSGDDLKGEIDKMSGDQQSDMKGKMKSIIVQAASSSKASLEGMDDLKRDLDDFLNPKLDWRELLHEAMSSLVKKDYTFSRPSRKSWGCGCTLPGMADGTQVDAAFAIDVSGSMGYDAPQDLINEVKAIVDEYEDFNVHVMCFSTGIHNFESFTTDSIDDLNYYHIEGCGGTDFNCVYDELKERDIQPDQLVIMTDGYPGGSWGDENYCDTIFIITDNGPEAPFGISVPYTSRESA